MPIEKRYFAVDEIRMEGEGTSDQFISGYAAKFNVLSEDLGGFREKLAPGCFTQTLSEDEICSFWCHLSSQPLGNTAAGTLTLMQDEFGLAFRNKLPDTQPGRDAYTSIKRGDVRGVSFGFETIDDLWAVDPESGQVIRTLLVAKLQEISPTPIPAYKQTSVAARSIEQAKKMQEDFLWAQQKGTHISAAAKRAELESKWTKRRLLGLKLR